jgi:Mlc titration factor MtfA (ptsG expression regulator)
MIRARDRRRKQLRDQPIPAEWRAVLDTVPLYRRLPPDDREELCGHVQVLLEEKHFEGAGGLEITESMKLVIAAQAAVLLLHRPIDYYPKLTSIVVYPDEYSVQEEVATEDGLVEEIDETRVGESWLIGTLILSWEDVERDLEDGVQNVVLHEFTHQLDAEGGETNGAPIIADRELRQRWADAMSNAFERLVDAADRDEKTLIDPYGAEDPAEFFAVAVEAFFLTPRELEDDEPEMYAVLRDYFRQDPARW